METSVTIGITSQAETQEELESYLSQGFKIIKLKIGDSIEEDVSVVRKLREWGGYGFKLRVDCNQGYVFPELQQFIQATSACEIELIEQPLKVSDRQLLGTLPGAVLRKLAADEDLINEADSRTAVQESLYGIWNIKLMKSDGISPSRRISDLAFAHQVKVMWGCNDESRISISAALQVALSSNATHFLDLDGSFDIANDIVSGGFHLKDGRLHLTDQPGLGVSLLRH
jgi:L-alanine-DL-glutamate epimerase-like enolase superfamily enzyme